MCGIAGVALVNGRASSEVYKALKRLEYRGYDSAGVAVKGEDGIAVVKKSGRVDSLGAYIGDLRGNTAIGHTRWATHGVPSDVNAHPHVCGKFAVVHNGMIENYRELKAELTSRGVKFLSETDSEVVAALIDSLYDGDALAAVAGAVKRLKGSFALAVLHADSDGIIAVKYKSPVVVGFAEDGVYISSDIPALPGCVKEICLPEDGDVIRVTAKGADFYDCDLNPVRRAKKVATICDNCCTKGAYPHYMIKEINEAERTVRATAEAFCGNVDRQCIARWLGEADRIIITGCGTAFNAALVGKGYLEERWRAFCSAHIASELRYALPAVTPSTLVLVVTQSGETADVVEAATELKCKGARVVAITNCGYSAITRVAHRVVPVCAGAEISVAATKSYIGQIVALYLLSRLPSEAAAEEIAGVCADFDAVLRSEKAAEIASVCADSSAVFFLGRGRDYAVAREASLKLKEVSYIFSDGYPAGELKHGTLALIDENTLSVFFICDKAVAEKCENAVEQVVSRNGRAAVITTIPAVADSVKGRAAVWLLPECPEHLSPLISAVALQLIAYNAAVLLKRDPDKPRNLAKSVTVE